VRSLARAFLYSPYELLVSTCLEPALPERGQYDASRPTAHIDDDCSSIRKFRIRAALITLLMTRLLRGLFCAMRQTQCLSLQSIGSAKITL